MTERQPSCNMSMTELLNVWLKIAFLKKAEQVHRRRSALLNPSTPGSILRVFFDTLN